MDTLYWSQDTDTLGMVQQNSKAHVTEDNLNTSEMYNKEDKALGCWSVAALVCKQ